MQRDEMLKALEEAHKDYENRKLAILYDLNVVNKTLYYYELEGKICQEAYDSFKQVIDEAMKFINEKEV